MKRCFIVFVGIFLWTNTIVAQLSGDIRFEHYNAQNGLLTSNVTDVFQDSTGFIWFCSSDGLFRFDAYQFKNFTHDPEDPSSIVSNDVKCGFVDAKQRIWIGSNWGLDLYDPVTETFQNFHDTMSWNRLVLDIKPAGEDKLWLGTWHGLVRWDYQTQQAESFPFPEPVPDGRQGFNCTRRIFEDSRQRLWLCTWDGGLRVFDTEQEKYVAYYQHDPNDPNSIASNDVRDVLEDEQGNIWVAVWDGGLHLFDPETNTFKKFLFLLERNHRSYNQINGLLLDSKGNLWMTTQKGLVLFDRQSHKYHFFEQNSQLYHAYKGMVSSAIFEDNHQGLWIAATQSNVNYFNLKNLKFNAYQHEEYHPNSPSGLTVRNIVSHPNGKLYISYLNTIDEFDPETGQFTKLDFRPLKHDANFGAMTIDHQGKTWLSVDHLYCVDFQTGEKDYFTAKDLHQQEVNPKLRKLSVDAANNLWISYERALVYKPANQKTFASFSFNHTIRHFEIDHNKQLWYTDSTLKRLAISDSSLLLQDSSYDVAQAGGLRVEDHQLPMQYFRCEANGLIYGIKNQQLIIYDSKIRKHVVHHIPFEDERTTMTCLLKEDQRERYWIGTNTGLYAFSPKTKDLLHFTTVDGLLEIYIKSRALSKHQAYLFFSGEYSFFGFKPENIIKNSYAPSIVLTDLKIFNQSLSSEHNDSTDLPILRKAINELSEITLSYDQNSLTFEFAALNFFIPEKNHYQCQLVGFDDHWVDLGTENRAVYSNLEPGTYTFRVRGSNNNGVWSKEIKELTIVITPPWWKTQWAQMGYLLLFVGLIMISRKLLMMKINYQKKMEIERMQFQTQHQLLRKEHDLEQVKMKFFMNISHEFRTPLTLILGPLERLLSQATRPAYEQEQLNLIQRNALRLQRLINQLLDLRKLETGKMQLNITQGNMLTFLQQIFRSFTYMAERHIIDYQMNVETGHVLAIDSTYFDADKLEKIMYNLLSNAFKYTPDHGEIKMSVKQEDNTIQVEVFNTGPLIPADKLPHVFDRFFRVEGHEVRKQSGTGIGLSLTKELVELHHGTITAHTEAGVGNFFTIQLPVGKASYPDSQATKQNVFEEEKYPHVDLPNEQAHLDTATQTVENEETKAEYILLIVDDNPDIRSFVKSNISSRYMVIEAAHGQEGLVQAFAYIPDLIISDIMMPRMDGITFSKTIKNDTRTSHIPLILLTARASAEHQIEGYQTGADDYISKPFNIATLSAKIDNMLRTRQHLQKHLKQQLGSSAEITIDNPVDKRYIQKLVGIVKDNLADPEFGIEQLCREAAMSKSNLYRKLQALTGQTAADFIRSIRLNHAAQLICSTENSFAEIAIMSGFNDVSYFRTCFKKQFGKTATAYRKENIT